jgi:hypothetical protein
VNTSISPQVRVLAIVGLVAAVGLGASMMLLGRGGSSSDTTPASTTPVHRAPRTHSAPPAVTPKPVSHRHATKPVAHAPATTRHAPARHHAKHARPAKPAGFRGNRVYAQLPQTLQWQLAHHKIVVVSIYNPRSEVDAISVAEAHAGAVDAHAGFLLVSVLDNSVAGILTALLPGGGLLPDPGVLVYRAPGEVAVRLDGFADRDAVAQAATNALHGETDAAPASTVPATPAAIPAPAPAATTTTTP